MCKFGNQVDISSNLLWVLNLLHIKFSENIIFSKRLMSCGYLRARELVLSKLVGVRGIFTFLLHVILLRLQDTESVRKHKVLHQTEKWGTGNGGKKSFLYPISSRSKPIITSLVIILKKNKRKHQCIHNKKFLRICSPVAFYTSTKSEN